MLRHGALQRSTAHCNAAQHGCSCVRFPAFLRTQDDDWSGSGDVKYHLGTSYDRPTIGGGMVHISLLPNPSHLEAVDPVVVGKCKAKGYFKNGTDHAA